MPITPSKHPRTLHLHWLSQRFNVQLIAHLVNPCSSLRRAARVTLHVVLGLRRNRGDRPPQLSLVPCRVYRVHVFAVSL